MNNSNPSGAAGGSTSGEGGAASGFQITYVNVSLRDWFAGQVLVGLCADRPDFTSLKEIAEECYRQADAMLEARQRV